MSVLLRPTIGCYDQQCALTVRGGFGGGSYAAADSTFVLANPTPAGFVFDRWQTTAALRDTFVMPTRLPGHARPPGHAQPGGPRGLGHSGFVPEPKFYHGQLSICFTRHKFHNDQEYDLIRFFDRFAASIVTAATPVAFVAPALQAYPNPTLSWVALVND